MGTRCHDASHCRIYDMATTFPTLTWLMQRTKDESAHTPRYIFVRQHAVLIRQIILLRITLMIAIAGPDFRL